MACPESALDSVGGVDRVEQWLHSRRHGLRQWRRDDPGGGVDELLERALAGIEALEVAGALSGSDAAAWRERLGAEATDDPQVPSGSAEARAAGERVLEELLRDIPPALEGGEDRLERFEGAVYVLAAVGAADGAEWDARLRRRLGWPSAEEEWAQERARNAGDTEVDLVAVLPGPGEWRAGHRVVVALRFEDGIALLVDKDPAAAPETEWPEWRLGDDRGTPYWPGGGSGGDTDEHVSFRPAPPPEARWVELVLEDHPEATFRVEL